MTAGWLALLHKVIREARGLALACALLLFAFAWLFVWLISQLDLGAISFFLKTLPAIFERLGEIGFGGPPTPTGMIGALFFHPVILVTIIGWSIARGSDAVSGELGRGTMEVLLAQPVSRWAILVTQALATSAGAVLLPLALWLGITTGLTTIAVDGAPQPMRYFPAIIELMCLGFCVGGLTTLVSSFDRFRGRTIGLAAGAVLVEYIVMLIARLWPAGAKLRYLTFFGGYEPQLLIANPAGAWHLAAWHCSALLAIGIVGYGLALWEFSKRDLPAPL